MTFSSVTSPSASMIAVASRALARRPPRRSSRRSRCGRPSRRCAHAHLARDDHVEAVVRCRPDAAPARRAGTPSSAGAHHLPDLRVREVVEEAQLAQDGEVLLVVDPGLRGAQLLVHARQVGRELRAVAVAVARVLLQRRDDDVLELLGNARAQRAERLGRRSARSGAAACRARPPRNGRYPLSISYITAPSE